MQNTSVEIKTGLQATCKENKVLNKWIVYFQCPVFDQI